MKKIVFWLSVFVMLCGFIACGTTETETPDAPKGEDIAAVVTPEPTPTPDPWEPFESEEEAENAAGFEIRLPAMAEASVTYNVMTGGDPIILEAVFSDGDAEVFRVRKAPGTVYIGEDANEYGYTEATQPYDNVNVTLSGDDENSIRTAAWLQTKDDGEYSYCVSFAAAGVGTAGALKLVDTVVEDQPKGYTYGINKALSTGEIHTVALKKDGTVVATGSNAYGICDVEDWTDIVAVGAGRLHTVGLKSDGTVVATGANNAGQLRGLDTWTDIVAINCGEQSTYGFKADGTVLHAGALMDEDEVNHERVESFTNVKDMYLCIFLFDDNTVRINGRKGREFFIEWDDCGVETVSCEKSDGVGASCNYCYYAVLNDGRVISRSMIGSYWTDVVEIEEWYGAKRVVSGYGHSVAVMPDGTVRGKGFNLFGQAKTGEWTDIVDCAAMYFTTVGLKADGTVVAIGDNTFGQCNVSEWTDIGFPGMDEPNNEAVVFDFSKLFETEANAVDEAAVEDAENENAE